MGTLLFSIALGMCVLSIGTAFVGLGALLFRHVTGTNTLPQLPAERASDAPHHPGSGSVAHAAV